MSPVDGVPRQASDDPSVHRELVVLDPPMEGRDVANYQRALRDRLTARGLLDDVPVPTHAKFTHATWVAGVEAGYFLGLRSETYLATMKVGGQPRGRATEGAQTIARNPDQRDAGQIDRAKARQGQLDRGPRYYDELAKTIAVPHGKGPQAALAFLGHHLGLHEVPAGSNWGPVIEDWIRLAGYTSPVPWCGCATNAAIVAAGVANGAAFGIGYCPNVVTHAQAGRDGWTWHTDGAPGDIILFAGSDGIAEHQGLVRERIAHDHYLTREGNTSSGTAGSQSNGGMLADRERISTPGFRIIGFARPSYPA